MGEILQMRECEKVMKGFKSHCICHATGINEKYTLYIYISFYVCVSSSRIIYVCVPDPRIT